MRLIFLFLAIMCSTVALAQTGSVSGTVVDEANGQTLIGVTVSLKGVNQTAMTDYEGKFSFRNVPAGTYEIEFVYMGYQSKTLPDVVVVANDNATVNITMSSGEKTLQEVVVKTTRAKSESVRSLLLQQKNAVTVSDGISAETIKRTPDKNTSDVLKRISGASIQDNRFVIIRGLNDRYNTALLNGAPLPSSEPDRKAFSFDIFPANMIDNLIITKTASPDMPGEFAGGVVQINTKAVPEKNFQTISIGTGYNTITTFKDERTYKGSSTDWLGYDNGNRAFPSSIPSVEAFGALTAEQRAQLAKTFNYDWAINDGTFAPNYNFQYTIGRHYDLGDNTLGFLFSVMNNNSKTFSEITRKTYDDATVPGGPTSLVRNYNDANYQTQVLSAALANVAYKFGSNHTLSLKNIFSVNSTDLVVDRYGQPNVADTFFIDANVRWFTSNRIYSGQLNGDHFFAEPKIKLGWNVFYSDISRDIPNLRRNIYYIDPTNPDQAPIALIAANNGGADYGGGMFFSENKETINGGKIDIAKKFDFNDEQQEVKVGGFIQKRDRDFFARQLQYNQPNEAFDISLLSLPDETIFAPENMGEISPGVNGFTLFDASKVSDRYIASSDLAGGYAMLDNRYKKFRLVWGVRYEAFRQRLNAKRTETDIIDLNKPRTDVLPSVNLIYSLNDKTNLRVSYSRTLNRPEFRELAPFGFYDFTTTFFTQGNDSLKVSRVRNFDIRYEVYPGNGQMFSVSYFRKKFTDPIELKQEANNSTVTYRNALSAKSSGVELEFRALLSSFVGGESAILDDFTLFSNLAIIKSETDTSNFASVNTEQSRPMQGQSPYVFNAGIQYLNKDNGWAVSANLNRVGNRILVAEGDQDPALWEKGRTLLDMQVVKTMWNNKLELKLNIQNLLAQDLITYNNNYRENESFGTLETLANGIFTGDYHYKDGFSKDDDEVWRATYGATFSLSATYNF